MEKEEFISELKKVLGERGYSGDALEEKLAAGISYLEKHGADSEELTPELLAEGLSLADADAAADPLPEDGTEPAQEAPAAEEASLFADLPQDGTNDAPDAAPADDSQAEDAATEPARAAAPQDGLSLDDYSPTAKKKKKKKLGKKEKKQQERELSEADEVPESEKQSYDFTGDENGNGIGGKIFFWVTLVIALPFIILLALLALVIYIGIWIVLALLMIACITLLIAFVGGGVAISFVGIVYGALQIIKGAVPVGLFEIGLGIIVGSVVMLVSILIYNFAVRLIPFVMKQLTKLLSAAYRGGRLAVEAVKGACERA